MEMEIRKPVRTSVLRLFEPVTLDEAKKQLELAADSTDHDDHIRRLIAAARDEFERDSNYVLCTGTYVWQFTNFPCPSEVEFPLQPVTSIDHLKYIDTAGNLQTFDETKYSLDPNGRLNSLQLNYLEFWPVHQAWTDTLEIQFRAGYLKQSDIPESIKQAILVRVTEGFENRSMDLKAGMVSGYERLQRRYVRMTYP